MSISLQKLASIDPRASLIKFQFSYPARNFSFIFFHIAKPPQDGAGGGGAAAAEGPAEQDGADAAAEAARGADGSESTGKKGKKDQGKEEKVRWRDLPGEVRH